MRAVQLPVVVMEGEETTEDDILAEWSAFSGADKIGEFRIVRSDGRVYYECRESEADDWNPQRSEFAVVPETGRAIDADPDPEEP